MKPNSEEQLWENTDTELNVGLFISDLKNKWDKISKCEGFIWI